MVEKLTPGEWISGERRVQLSAEVAQEYLSGETVTDIAQRLGRPNTFVYTLLLESRTPLRGSGVRTTPKLT
ncbi:helix-turn-helix domain-containing protein [Saccharopolyspora sp. NPDC050642]|uniref:helix-turn-helix domain-containing protein n=1 Tax=Saccharopolyspora sp. NPDC050642 TaxID=3157099 RepID=UPI00340D5DB2